MKVTEHIRKRGKFYPDKPYDPYNIYPYNSVKEVRDSCGDSVESTDGYKYFIVWIPYVPSNRPKVVLFVDKEDMDVYLSNPFGWENDSLHYTDGTKCLSINGRSAEELNNYIAKILMDFYNKRIYEYIEKNKPQTQTSSSISDNQSSNDTHNDSSERRQLSSSSPNAPSAPSERPKVNNAPRKSRYEIYKEFIEKYPHLQGKGETFPKLDE